MSASGAVRGVEAEAGTAFQSVAEASARFGYVVRGVIYLVPGVFALRLAMAKHGEAMTPTGAIQMIARQPSGQLLLLAVAVGLAGYILWCMVRAVGDPFGRGRSAKGLMKRAGNAASGIAYAALLLATVRLLRGSEAAPDQGDWTGRLLHAPAGAWLVGGIGVWWIIAPGALQIVSGWRATFLEEFDNARLGRSERRWARRIGRVGFMARGFVFAIVGVLFVTAAIRRNARDTGGIDDAMLALWRHRDGPKLLAITACGLILFGVFSILCARWERVCIGRRISRT